MASFWDEIQKQYANAEDRVNRAKEAGINMLARKGDMINQGFNNALAVLTGQGNMLGQVSNVQDSMYGRAIQQDQFGKSLKQEKDIANQNLNFNRDQLNFQKTKAQKDYDLSLKDFFLRKKSIESEMQDIIDANNAQKEIAESQYAQNINALLSGTKNKMLKTQISNQVNSLRKQGKSSKEIFNKASELVSSLSYLE